MGRRETGGERYFALRTFGVGGRGRVTPVWLAAGSDGRHYLLTPERSHKMRRLRRDPRVQVAPSDFDGTARGEWRRGRAKEVDGAERAEGLSLLAARYGLSFRWFRLLLALGRPRRAGGRAVVVRLDLDAAP
ncbi:pyridoxamine 5'-phosphate oxidase family protein [Pseudonocardia alni]|uniref:pyridoxamine 5'-phosphate oxidase family protein n=1 Tax=Pseudonocardia alni TaxID=33907 RepID=UPI002479DC5E|nr:pyridoxamine 5'-phosphate oxidase family protein [Pseudonocardia alni]WFG47202.1 PPOX class F420-dependent oxidoreductase [Pseudonocardia alni]